MSSGWIKLHRQLLENPMWTEEPFTRSQAWIDILLLANHEPGSFRVRGIRVEVARGQVARGVRSFSSRWQWSHEKVLRFFKDLEEDGMVERIISNVIAIVSIKNYDSFQAEERKPDSKSNANRTQIERNKKEKNVKNEKTTGEILKWLAKMEIKMPEAYLANLRKKASELAIAKAWKDARRGVGIGSPGDFYARCLYWNTH